MLNGTFAVGISHARVGYSPLLYLNALPRVAAKSADFMSSAVLKPDTVSLLTPFAYTSVVAQPSSAYEFVTELAAPLEVAEPIIPYPAFADVP